MSHRSALPIIVVRLGAFAHAAKYQLDGHPDSDLALMDVRHLAEKSSAAVEIDDGHDGGLHGPVI